MASSKGTSLGKGKRLAGVDEGGKPSLLSGVRKEGARAKPDRRDGVVERAISEADDMVVCMLEPGGGEDGRDGGG